MLSSLCRYRFNCKTEVDVEHRTAVIWPEKQLFLTVTKEPVSTEIKPCLEAVSKTQTIQKKKKNHTVAAGVFMFFVISLHNWFYLVSGGIIDLSS